MGEEPARRMLQALEAAQALEQAPDHGRVREQTPLARLLRVVLVVALVVREQQTQAVVVGVVRPVKLAAAAEVVEEFRP